MLTRLQLLKMLAPKTQLPLKMLQQHLLHPLLLKHLQNKQFKNSRKNYGNYLAISNNCRIFAPAKLTWCP